MNPQTQGQAGQPSQGLQLRLLKPEQLRGLPVLTPDEITKYEDGLRQLWETVKNNPPESQAHINAKNKIAEFSRMVYKKISSLQMRQQQQQQQQRQQQQQQQNQHQQNQHQQQHQQQQQQQGPPRAQQPGGTQATPFPQAGQNQPIQSPINPPQNPAAIAANRPQGQGIGNTPSNPQGPAPNAPPGNAQRPQQTQVSKGIIEHCNSLPWGSLNIPQHIAPDQSAKYIQNVKQKYMSSLVTMEQAKSRIQRIEHHVKEKEERGQPVSAEEMKKIQEQKDNDTRLHAEAQKFIQNVRIQFPQANNAGANRQGPNTAQQMRPQAGPMPGQNPAATASNSMQAMTASVNAAMESAKNQQIAAANRAQAPPGQSQISGPPAAPATPATTGAQQQQSHPATAPQPQVKIEPGTQQQQPHPPPVNTALAAASAAHIQPAGTPTQASARVQTPQSATQPPQSQPHPQPQQQGAPGGPVRPLTHAAAVNRANSSTNINTQPGPAHNGVTPTPGASSMMSNNSQPSHPHAHPQQPSATTINSKMPIPKTLPEKATAPPTAVSVGGGVSNNRPSLGGGMGIPGGVQGQPVIQKNTNAYNFDADGEHVMSKKKLDELTRQVVGGQPGIDGNYMTPDVEEAALNAADAFVDNVTETACRLAAARGSKVLETRDLQMAIERTYNIRIPGYTTDELRTVRKVQPHPSWIAKMSAIQAAKVTSAGKDDK